MSRRGGMVNEVSRKGKEKDEGLVREVEETIREEGN